MTLTKLETKELIETIWERLAKGESESDLCEMLGLEPEEYETKRKAMLIEKASEYKNKPPEHMFVEYVIWQLRGINDLTELVEKLKVSKTPNANAIVAAIKVRSDVYDKVIAKGQEFGVLRKSAAESKISIGGITLADLTNEKLRTQITSAIGDMDKLMKRYGDMSMTEVDPGVLHHGPRLLESSIDTEGTTVVVEAPPAKDDVVVPAAKPKAEGPRTVTHKNKKSKATANKAKTKARGVRSPEIKEEMAASRNVFEGWGD